jgi:hypothetical protein
MPKRKGYFQLVVQVPEAVMAASDAKRGEETPRAQYVCELIATDAGIEYEPPKKGAPKGTPRKTKPGPKPGVKKKPKGK